MDDPFDRKVIEVVLRLIDGQEAATSRQCGDEFELLLFTTGQLAARHAVDASVVITKIET